MATGERFVHCKERAAWQREARNSALILLQVNPICPTGARAFFPSPGMSAKTLCSCHCCYSFYPHRNRTKSQRTQQFTNSEALTISRSRGCSSTCQRPPRARPAKALQGSTSMGAIARLKVMRSFLAPWSWLQLGMNSNWALLVDVTFMFAYHFSKNKKPHSDLWLCDGAACNISEFK